MATATARYTLTSSQAYQDITGSELKISGAVVNGQVELWLGTTTPTNESGVPLLPGQTFSYVLESGEKVWARSARAVTTIIAVHRQA